MESATLLSAWMFLTGACALMYELVWARWLMLAFGAGAQSMALIVASTMLGLALGSEWGGRLADRTRRKLRLYGYLEIAVGLSAAAASAILRSASWNGFAGMPAGAAMAAAILLIGAPTALMGATLPALVAYAGRSGADLRAAFGRLYAANTIGAVLGAVATGFFLVRNLGLWDSAVVAALINVAVGLAAVRLDERKPAAGRPAEPESGHLVPGPALKAAWAGAVASGLTSMALEVLDSRLLVYGFLSTTHALTIILASFLAGLALGAHIISSRLKSRALVGQLGAALLVSAVLGMALAPSLTRAGAFVIAMRDAFPAWGIRMGLQAALAAILLVPATTVMGFAFPVAAAIAARSSEPGFSAGRMLLVNTLSGAVGSLAAAFILLPALGLRGAVVLSLMVQALAGAWILQREPSWPKLGRRMGWILCGAVAAAGAAWARPPVINGMPGQGTLVAQHVFGHEKEFQVLCYKESPIATTEVLQHRFLGIKDLVIDGFVTAGNAPSTGYMALMGSLPMRIHPDPRRALVICFGTGATARAVRAWREASLDVVDINPDVFRCAAHFSPDNAPLLAGANVHVEDGRRFLRRAEARYDVITQEPMPPYFAGTAALYSAEYYRLTRHRLAPDGLMVQWLPFHLVAPRDAREIVAAAQSVFPETWLAIAPDDGTGILVSSMRPLDPGRLRRLGIKIWIDPAGLRRYAAGAAPVTDDRPTLEYSGIDRVRGTFHTSGALQRYNLAEILSVAGGIPPQKSSSRQ